LTSDRKHIQLTRFIINIEHVTYCRWANTLKNTSSRCKNHIK